MTQQDIAEIERQIVTKVLEDLIAAGFLVAPSYGGGAIIVATDNVPAILGELWACDEEYLLVQTKTRENVGWILLVYGNDGTDVIADYTVNLEPYLMGEYALGEALE